MKKEKGRRVRSDKKIDVKPYLDLPLKDAIYRLNYITRQPVKDIAEAILVNAMFNRNIIEELSKYFKRDIVINNTLYVGHLDNPRLPKRNFSIKVERISLRLPQNIHEYFYDVSHALGNSGDKVSVARVIAIYIEKGIQDLDFLNEYINKHVLESLTERQKKELQKVLEFINAESGEEHSFAALLSFIVDEFKQSTQSTKDALNDFIVKKWKNKDND